MSFHHQYRPALRARLRVQPAATDTMQRGLTALWITPPADLPRIYRPAFVSALLLDLLLIISLVLRG